jgi:hypothetical protein
LNELDIARKQFRALHFPSVTGIDAAKAQRLFHLAMALAPEGIRADDFVPLPIGDTTWELRFFTNRGSGKDVEFCVFLPNTRYAREGFIVHDDGLVETTADCVVPESDVRPDEPKLPAIPELLALVSEVINKRVAG